MGLDACVYCDCLERGALRSPPDDAWEVYVALDGMRDSRATDMDLLAAFDRWNQFACEHEDGILLHHRIGNIALVATFRHLLQESGLAFPVMLEQVLYSGTHCGDWIHVEDLGQLEAEVAQLSQVRGDDAEEEAFMREFEAHMKELVATAMQLNKPIVF